MVSMVVAKRKLSVMFQLYFLTSSRFSLHSIFLIILGLFLNQQVKVLKAIMYTSRHFKFSLIISLSLVTHAAS